VTSDDPVRVRIRFSRDQARYVQERRWAAEQRIKENEDGSIILEMTTSGHWEIARWVLTWGGEAEVLEPKALREMVAAEVGRMARVYQNCR
jgi:predicted DNA-binding transcriptional regulator YafY